MSRKRRLTGSMLGVVTFLAGLAMAEATAVNRLSAFLAAHFFLSLVEAAGESTAFFLFSALCVASFVFVQRLVPETKGRSLEEIQERWVLGGDRMLDVGEAAAGSLTS